MSQYTHTKKIGFLDLIWHYKYSLAVYIVVISTISFIGLYFIGGVPDELKVVDENAAIPQVSAVEAQPAPVVPQIKQNTGELPTRVVINKIGVDVAVHNTSSTDNTVLNNLLLSGAVRYPGSGTLAHGNMFIFAHSTGLRIVNNQAFKAFDHLKDLNIDDTIKIQSATKEYTYKVISVSLIDSDKALVDLSSSDTMLTLSTCDVFGQKQQRFVVQALFVSSKSL